MKIKLDGKTIGKLLLLAGAAGFNFTVYFLGRTIARDFYHYDFTTAFDRTIPFIPWTILIYWGAYALWIANYCLSVRYDKSGFNRTLLAHYIGETVCFLCFVFLPTTMVRAEITGTGLFDRLMEATYTVDSADNLLPSIHCFVSWIAWIGVRNNKNIPKAYSIFSLIFASAVCISTLTVKQHVIADVITGVGLAELSYFVAGKLGKLIKKEKETRN
ncbi:MAG: phosphatidic acid phosphatase [Lachnospiraceae bacterium]|nr:phosphatidic acid phosphatase [Lachnospiraceae bacterium]